MFNEDKFRSVIRDRGKTLQEVADMLHINLVTLYRKMNGESDFYRNEIEILQRELCIEDAQEIFFCKINCVNVI